MQLFNFIFLLPLAFASPEPFVPYKNDLLWDDAMSQGLALVTFQYDKDGQPITLATWSNPDHIAGLDYEVSARDGPEKGGLKLVCSWQEGVACLSLLSLTTCNCLSTWYDRENGTINKFRAGGCASLVTLTTANCAKCFKIVG